MRKLFSSTEIVEDFGEIDITVIPEKERIEEILRIKMLRKLTVEIERPNPDDLDGLEHEILEEMANENIGRKKVEIIAQKGSSISPSEATKNLSRVAANNGHVEGEGYDSNGKRVRESTVDHPLIRKTKFDSKTTTIGAALIAFATKVFEEIL